MDSMIPKCFRRIIVGVIRCLFKCFCEAITNVRHETVRLHELAEIQANSDKDNAQLRTKSAKYECRIADPEERNVNPISEPRVAHRTETLLRLARETGEKH